MISPINFLHIVFVVAIYWIGVLYHSFLLDIVIAGLLSIATSATNYRLTLRLHSSFLASLFLTILLAALVLIPMVYFVFKIAEILQNVDLAFFERIKNLFVLNVQSLEIIPTSYKEMIVNYLQNVKYEDYIARGFEMLERVGQGSLRFFSNMVLILVFYFFANLYGKQILLFFKRVLPLKGEDSQMIFDEMGQTMSVVLYSTLFNAIFQGALFSLVAWYLGYDPFFMGIAYSFASLVPVIGGAIMWVPVAIYEFSLGNTANAVIVALYTVIVISLVADTFVKPVIIDFISKYLVRTQTKINSLLIFFAILAGISTYGFWGIILGPAVTALFISLLKIYDTLKRNKEGSMEEPKF
jgi:predicted PurR-regulated permease PerM